MLDFDIGIVHIIKFSPMKTIIFVCVSLLFICCNNPKVVEEKPYVISVEKKRDELRRETDSLYIPLPPFNFYLENHLILSKNQDLYYYQLGRADFLMDCVPRQDSIPIFKNLQVANLVNVTHVDLDSLFKYNILNKGRSRNHIVLGSQCDTIKNQNLLKSLKSSRIPIFVFRRTTQEEDTVLHYKIRNEIYISDYIKWDMKRIYFSDKML